MFSSNKHSRNSAKISTSWMNGSSAPQPVKRFGLTTAISWEHPQPGDIQKTQELHKALESHNVFESEVEAKHRIEILAKLNSLYKQWVKDISIAKNMPQAAANKVGGKVFTFGSYRMGVHHKGADIDALCVAPGNIERIDFFTSFFTLLKKQREVTECRAIEEAYVPVIKMNYDGTEIDLLFARLSLTEIPDNFDLSDDNILKNIDPKSVRSLNGCRVTDEILASVPNPENFRVALCAIKLWAKKRGIYSNSLGYFGGVTWAMLMARVCQLYPNAIASTLIQKFFLVFTCWKWPNPVLLKRIENTDSRFPVWDPRVNVADRYHLMPIITPAYPQQNSTFNVTESTREIIVAEINRGKKIMEDGGSWETLFEAPNFFSRYRHYIVLLANSQSATQHLEWCGLVESKIRFLIANLDRNPQIKLAHVNPKSFDHRKDNNNNQYGATPFCSMWFVGLEFEPTANNINLTENIKNFTDLVIQHGAKTKICNEGISIDAQHVKRKLLNQYLDDDFLKMERKTVVNKVTSNNTISAKRKMLPSENSTSNAKRLRVSESVRSQRQ